MADIQALKTAVSAIFRRKGKKTITEEEFVFAASMELRWFPPDRAALFLRNAKRAGLILQKEGGICPSFDINSKDIKQVITPPLTIAEEPGDAAAEIVEAIASSLRLSKSEAMARVNRVRKELNLETAAAAVLVGLKEHLDMSEYAELALDEMRRNYGHAKQ
ncbi:MAG: DUF2240 family protein [Methanomassiliicoccales archaeon]|nr:DUF2240 family protein [Methanomassiliicoccales archaeon]